MLFGILADLVVVVHFLFVVFVVVGGALAFRWRWMPWLHLPAALWGALIELQGWICPLTPLENDLRRRAGEVGYAGGFVENYLLPILYPGSLTREIQIGLGVLVIVINAGVYGLLVRRRRSAPLRTPGEVVLLSDTESEPPGTEGRPMESSASVRHVRWEDLPKERVTDDIQRRLVTGERMMLAHVYLEKGAVVPTHSHDNEQLTYILEGALRFWIGEDGEEEVVVRAGEVLHIPSDVPHRAQALEDTLDVDVFSPPRQDWLDGTDTYFHDED